MLIKLSTFLYLVLVVSCLQTVYGAVTEEQMWAAGKLMRDVCLPKFPKVGTDTADKIRNGEFPTKDQKDARCYINCMMEMMQSIKKGKFLYESSLRQVDLLLPDEYQDSYRVGLGKCRDAIGGVKNHCDAAVALLECLRREIDKFVFP